MSEDGPLYRPVIPEGSELSDSTRIPGAKSGLVHGPSGVRTQADWVAVERRELSQDRLDGVGSPVGRDAAIAAGGAMGGVLAILGLKAAAPHARRLLIRGKDRVFRGRKSRSVAVESPPRVSSCASPSQEVTLTDGEERFVMSLDEFRARLLAAMKVQAFVDEQIDLLSSAEIVAEHLDPVLSSGISKAITGQVHLMTDVESRMLLGFLRSDAPAAGQTAIDVDVHKLGPPTSDIGE